MEAGQRTCFSCGKGRLSTAQETVAFRQWTDRGYVHCQVMVPVTSCPHCGQRTYDDGAAAIMDEAVRRAYAEQVGPEEPPHARTPPLHWTVRT
jgi:hypothetical protein